MKARLAAPRALVRIAVAAACIALLHCAQPAALRAQAAPDRDYSAAIASALQEYKLGHFNEAKAFFAQAHTLEPSARTLRGLGLTCYELRSYVEAIGFLREALANRVKPLTPAMRSEVTSTLEQARHFVARLQLQLAPPHARVAVDGRPVQRDASGALLFDPGDHELSFQADGYQPAARNVHAVSGDTLELSVELTARHGGPEAEAYRAPAAAPELATAADASEPPGSAGGPGAGPYILIAGAGAVAIGGGVLLALALSDKAHVEQAAPGSSYANVRDAEQRVPWMSGTGIAMLAAGLAGAGVGLVWALSGSSAPPAADAAASLRLTPAGATLEAHY